MKISLDHSLKNFRTDYIDILYLHYWDLYTSIEEIMDGLHNLVVSGKVLYLVRSFLPVFNVECITNTFIPGRFGHTRVARHQSK